MNSSDTRPTSTGEPTATERAHAIETRLINEGNLTYAERAALVEEYKAALTEAKEAGR